MSVAGPEKIILVAMTGDRVIGRGNTIPWHLPAELRLFRELTLGHPVIMGRRTFESIGRPLPGRRNLVVSRTLPPAPDEVEVCRSLDEALQRAAPARKVFFIGGAEIYRQALPLADTLRISWIAGRYEGDVLFPEFAPAEWEAVEETAFADFRHAVYRRCGRNGGSVSRGEK
jgi:dihydrofolate reductase